MSGLRVTALVGVYDADHTLVGEAAYVLGKVVGLRHCGLCDVTHSPVRRKPAWDAFAAGLDVPFELLHRDERDAALTAATPRLAAVVARLADGTYRPLLGPEELDAARGDVAAFGVVLARARAAAGV